MIALYGCCFCSSKRCNYSVLLVINTNYGQKKARRYFAPPDISKIPDGYCLTLKANACSALNGRVVAFAAPCLLN